MAARGFTAAVSFSRFFLGCTSHRPAEGGNGLRRPVNLPASCRDQRGRGCRPAARFQEAAMILTVLDPRAGTRVTLWFPDAPPADPATTAQVVALRPAPATARPPR